MSLEQKINQDIKAAMLAKEKDKLAALRAIKSALLLETTKGGSSELTEEIGNKILQKLYKQRIDAGQLYKEQNRDDLAQEEFVQAEIISAYLPKQMDEVGVRAEVVQAISDSGASGPSDMGKIMGGLMKKLSGKADGKLISQLVKEELEKL